MLASRHAVFDHGLLYGDGVFETVLARDGVVHRLGAHLDRLLRSLAAIGMEPPHGRDGFEKIIDGTVTRNDLRDAYVRWPEERVLDWAIRYWERARAAALPVPADFADFYRDFEWMGLQRHLKVLGIFARLCHRDVKDRYLAEIGRGY